VVALFAGTEVKQVEGFWLWAFDPVEDTDSDRTDT
jgi:hypothetical protein